MSYMVFAQAHEQNSIYLSWRSYTWLSPSVDPPQRGRRWAV